MKRVKRGEVNYLPDHPKGQADDTLEEQRLILVEELKKKYRNVLFSQKIKSTAQSENEPDILPSTKGNCGSSAYGV